MDFLKRYGIEISNQELLMEALTHSSYSNEHDFIAIQMTKKAL